MEETVDSGTMSPGKKMSPSKSMELSGEIDPETVRSALRDFAQSMKEAERERDESMTKANNLQRALAEMEEEKAHTDQRLQALQKSLGEAEEGLLLHEWLRTILLSVCRIIEFILKIETLTVHNKKSLA